jgi:hypothetical protein
MKNKVMRVIILNIIFIFNVFGIVIASTTSIKHIDPSKEVWPECPIPTNAKLHVLSHADSVKILWSINPPILSYIVKNDIGIQISAPLNNFKGIGNQSSISMLDSLELRTKCNANPTVLSKWVKYENLTKTFKYQAEFKVNNTCLHVRVPIFQPNVNHKLLVIDQSELNLIHQKNEFLAESEDPNFNVSISEPLSPSTLLFIVIQKNNTYLYLQINLNDNLEVLNSNCDDEFKLIACGDPVLTASNGSVRTNIPANFVGVLNGFPIKTLNAISNGGSTPILISLPFVNKSIAATVSGLSVSGKGITNGVIHFERDNTFSGLDTISNISIGGEICKPKENKNKTSDFDEEGYDQNGNDKNGFDRNGIHNETGGKYDASGFDKNGDHKDGGKFDQYGCNQEGKDIDGKPCSRPKSVEQIKQFSDSLRNSATFTSSLDSTGSKYKQTLNQQLALLNCNTLRTELQGLNAVSGVDGSANFIVGNTQEYLKLGMSEKFSSEPKPVFNNSGRDPKIINVENKHIQVYHCDVKELRITKIVNALDSLNISAWKTYLFIEMEKITPFQLNEFKKDSMAFGNWIINRLESFLVQSGIKLYVNVTTQKRAEEFNQHQYNPYFDMASLDDIQFDDSPSENYKMSQWLLDQGMEYVDGIHRVFYLDAIDKYRNANALNSIDEPAKLPFIIENVLGGVNYKLIIDQVSISLSGQSQALVYLLFDNPRNSAEKIVLQGSVSFTSTSFSGSVSLLNGIGIRVTNDIKLLINSGGLSANFSCNGVDNISVNGGLEICRNLVVPIDEQTLKPTTDGLNYRSDFMIYNVLSLNDIYLTLNANKPFAFSNLESVIWSFTNLVVDLSDKESPTTFPIPARYGGPLDLNWHGVAINSFNARFSSNLDSTSSAKQIIGNGILLDKFGFTGQLMAENFVTIDKGNLGGWRFSLDKVAIEIIKSDFSGSYLEGLIGVPVLKTDLGYRASFQVDNGISFAVKPVAAIDSMTLLGATMKLENTSSVTINYNNGSWRNLATLNGLVTLGGSEDMSSNAVFFNNLRVSNTAPYIGIGSVNLNDGLGFKIGNFSAQINGVQNAIVQSPEESGVRFGIKVGLEDKGDNGAQDLGLTAGGDFAVIGKLNFDEGRRQKWAYDRLEWYNFCVDGTASGAHIVAKLQRFKGDPKFGNGFMGAGKLTYKEFGLGAFALFGSNSSHKYYAVEAVAELGSQGVALGPVTLNGFLGAFAYNVDVTNGILRDNVTSLPSNSLSPSAVVSALSGNNYSPRQGAGYFLELGAKLHLTGSEFSFNGAGRLAFKFGGSAGGLQSASLNAVAYFMANRTAQFNDFNQTGGLVLNNGAAARVNLTYASGELSGLFDVFLNIENKIYGNLGGNKLVNGEIKIGKKDWWIYLGQPQTPAAARLQFGSVLGMNAEAYFCIGSRVPGIRPLPSELKTFFPTLSLGSPIRSAGSGFATGFRGKMDFDLNLFVGNLKGNGQIGVDLMLVKGGGLSCANGTPINGINGWYGAANMYAYIQGRLDILKINILEAGLATLLQFKGPQPTYASGRVGAYVQTRFFKLKKSFNLELGDKCEISLPNQNGNQQDNTPLIVDISPSHQSTNISPFEKINVSTVLPFNEEIDFEQTGRKYKLTKKEFSIFSHKSNANVYFSEKVDASNAFLIPYSELAPGDSLTVTAEVQLFDGSTLVSSDKKSASFKVSDTLMTIPIEAISSAYPAPGMKNFYKNQFNMDAYGGFINLERSSSLLYQTDATIECVVSQNGISSSYSISGVKDVKISFSSLAWLQSGNANLALIRTKDGVKSTILSYDFNVSTFENSTSHMATLLNQSTTQIGKDSILNLEPGYYTHAPNITNNCYTHMKGELTKIKSCNTFTVTSDISAAIQKADVEIKERNDMAEAIRILASTITNTDGKGYVNYSQRITIQGCVANPVQAAYTNCPLAFIQSVLPEETDKATVTEDRYFYAIPGAVSAYNLSENASNFGPYKK